MTRNAIRVGVFVTAVSLWLGDRRCSGPRAEALVRAASRPPYA